MNEFSKIDIDEKQFYSDYPKLLDIMLFDNNSQKNIIWATDLYSKKGSGYKFNDPIYSYQIVNSKGFVIKPRSKKSKLEQAKRSKDNAEVFTPSWVCNKQNNSVDEDWLGYKNAFNIEKNESWETQNDSIKFLNGRIWQDYVNDLRLEVSCGEAPYIVSRYDSVNGEYIPLKNRIGIFDRKMRVINERVVDPFEWIEWSIKALKSCYGFEWQGDNVFLARQNILFSYIDYYYYKFNELPSEKLLIEVTKILSWNIWQMDGLKFVIPNSCFNSQIVYYNLFGEEIVEGKQCKGCLKNNYRYHNGIYCKVMDWNSGKKIYFKSLINGGR